MFEQSGKQQQAGGLDSATAFLGRGAKIVGKISFDGPANVEGEIDGEVTSRDTLTVGKSATLKATIKGATVIVHGQVTGDIHATARLELHATSRIEGDVTAGSLVVQEGAVLNGRCTMGSAAKSDGRAKIEVGAVPVEAAPGKQASGKAS